MITCQTLRERIANVNAWDEIVEALGLNVSPQTLSRTASDEIILRAFVEGSIKSEKLRVKLHKHPFPDISKVGIYSDVSMEYTIGDGLTNAIQITSKAETHHHPFEKALKIFDFGCGTSRILRYMVEFCPGPKYYTSEVFLENIKWGQKAFPEVTYLHQSNLPPLKLEDASFDIIYAYSIFTHFEEKFHSRWLSELNRILQPGGLLILTVHGNTILRRFRNEDDLRNAMYLKAEDYESSYERFVKEGYLFYRCYDNAWMAKGGLDAEVFGMAYISIDYMKRNWTDRFEILEHDEGAVRNFQDYVVLKKSITL